MKLPKIKIERMAGGQIATGFHVFLVGRDGGICLSLTIAWPKGAAK